jgi:ubiquinone/menaquinone biosynthesis C-methylase UbiE
MPDREWRQALWPDPGRVLEDVGVGDGMRVVDLCCGDGYFTVPMAQLVGDGQVFAVELCEGLTATARAGAASLGATSIGFFQGDAMRLAELVQERVDLALIANAFHGAPDDTGLARAIAATLRSGGTFVVINWWPRPREETTVLGEPRGPNRELRSSPEQVAAWVEPAGSRLREVRDVGPYHNEAIFERAGRGS